ncbi:esterase-like activity of phytase family protein [Aureimonas sp. AU20]|uniref:esterase-like activity of phytase family protein n=1 Tax=Aureimonas sp. AU20 TaxID=1349819 RepID=UPI00071F5A97|nr:esterase-like activity of phytase family protein [Aureimonas sp. AU20]ALN74964.1 hypothetical protein M673_19750 [Aureimonas sp. AU20]
MRIRRLTALFLAAAAFAGAARAEPVAYPKASVSEAPGEETAVLNGETFVNHGLVAAARVPAANLDFLGDTLGSFSAMLIEPGSWQKTAEGYTARLRTLPDRGYNEPDKGFFSDYQGRLVDFDLSLKLDGKAGTLSVTPTGTGTPLTGFDGKPTTGADPASHTMTENGHVLPSPAEGALGAGRLSLDAEGVARRADGRIYVSDEYAADIYLFAADGRLEGIIDPSPAIVPMTDGRIDDNSLKAPDTGRRNNQGLEALSISPDGKTLFAVLQSGAVQDSSASKNQANRATTRVYVYDISADALPKAPKAVYALELPVYSKKGNGEIDATAALSEMAALSDHQFLLLTRDGNGWGCGCKNPEMVKQILVVDTAGATNLAGTDFETTTKPIAPKVGERNVLDPAITPVKSAVLVNMLNPVQLARVGLNIDNEKADAKTLSEKWEALALAPARDPNAPNDVFLFVGNDNDFLTTKGVMQGKSYDAGLDNDSMVLAYRLTLPETVKLGW